MSIDKIHPPADALELMHIFYVQSHSSLFACLQIIHARQLRSSNIAFVYGKDFGQDYESYRYASLFVGDEWRKMGSTSLWSGKEAASAIKSFDASVETLAQGKRFRIYVNRMNYLFANLASTHRLCAGIDVYEEGLAAHRYGINEADGAKSSIFEMIDILRKRLAFGRRYCGMRRFYDARYVNAYAMTAGAFPNFPRRIHVGLPHRFPSSIESKAAEITPNSVIICWKGTGRLKSTSGAGRHANLQELRSIIHSLEMLSFNQVYIRGHPDYPIEKEFLAELNRHGFRRPLVEHRMSVPLEAIMALRPDVSYCVGVSTVAIMAQAYKRRCYALMDQSAVTGMNLTKRMFTEWGALSLPRNL